MWERFVRSLLEAILAVPAVALALGIALVGVLHVYRYVKYEVSRK